jgi:thiamine-phosphate pyrophosphorylase
LAVARDAELAAALGAMLVHNPAGGTGGLPTSRSAHSLVEARNACEAGAALLFVAPIYPTSSHPGRPHLGIERATEIARSCPIPAIALGGVNRANFAPLKRAGFYGWAGIDAWLEAGPSRE